MDTESDGAIMMKLGMLLVGGLMVYLLVRANAWWRLSEAKAQEGDALLASIGSAPPQIVAAYDRRARGMWVNLGGAAICMVISIVLMTLYLDYGWRF